MVMRNFWSAATNGAAWLRDQTADFEAKARVVLDAQNAARVEIAKRGIPPDSDDARALLRHFLAATRPK